MSTLTVLQIVNKYLDRVDGFPVDSINDSDEAIQAASIIEDVYYRVVDKFQGMQSKTQIDTLEPSLDTDLPALMKLKRAYKRVHYSKINYNIDEDGGVKWQSVKFLSPEDFLTFTNGRSTKASNVQVMRVNDVPILIRNDKHPEFCTTFNDSDIIFDSFKLSVDTTLQEDKTQIIAEGSDVFLLEDTFEIPLPDHMHSGFLDLCLMECMENLRDIQRPSIVNNARRFWVNLQQDQKRIGNPYGIKRRYGRR